MRKLIIMTQSPLLTIKRLGSSKAMALALISLVLCMVCLYYGIKTLNPEASDLGIKAFQVGLVSLILLSEWPIHDCKANVKVVLFISTLILFMGFTHLIKSDFVGFITSTLYTVQSLYIAIVFFVLLCTVLYNYMIKDMCDNAEIALTKLAKEDSNVSLSANK